MRYIQKNSRDMNGMLHTYLENKDEDDENCIEGIRYKKSTVSYEFLNNILQALGTCEGETETYGERAFLRMLINKTENLMEQY